MEELGPNVELALPPGRLPRSASGRMIDRVNLYLHARRIAYREVRSGRAFVVHHVGPCSESSPSLIGRPQVPFIFGPVPTSIPAYVHEDEWLSWLRTPNVRASDATVSRVVARRIGPVAHFLWRRTLHRADAVTVEAQANVPYGSPKTVVIPPGVDVIQFSPRKDEQPVPGRIITVGGLLGRKGYDVVIRALARVLPSHRAAQLIVVGSGPHEQSLRALADLLGITASITFAGHVPRAELPRLLRSAEVFCHPARWDTFPLAPLEAMACGIPTVVSSVGALPEIVGRTGIVHTVGDDQELARHLVELLSSSRLRQALGVAARNRVVEHFTWQVMCDSYHELYSRLSDGHRVN